MTTASPRSPSSRGFALPLVLVVLSIVALVRATGVPYPAVIASADPLIKGGTLVAVLLFSALLAIIVARFDQKKADDYLFIALTRSAYLGMATLMFTLIIWGLFLAPHLGGLTSQVVIVLLAASWSVGYLYTRVFGTGTNV